LLPLHGGKTLMCNDSKSLDHFRVSRRATVSFLDLLHLENSTASNSTGTKVLKEYYVNSTWFCNDRIESSDHLGI
jgi:hypothetical protein